MILSLQSYGFTALLTKSHRAESDDLEGLKLGLNYVKFSLFRSSKILFTSAL